MRKGDEYVRWVEWSDDDQFYIGYCPDLFIGGCCHGNDQVKVYAELIGLIEDEVESAARQGRPLPEVKARLLATA